MTLAHIITGTIIALIAAPLLYAIWRAVTWAEAKVENHLGRELTLTETMLFAVAAGISPTLVLLALLLLPEKEKPAQSSTYDELKEIIRVRPEKKT